MSEADGDARPAPFLSFALWSLAALVFSACAGLIAGVICGTH